MTVSVAMNLFLALIVIPVCCLLIAYKTHFIALCRSVISIAAQDFKRFRQAQSDEEKMRFANMLARTLLVDGGKIGSLNIIFLALTIIDLHLINLLG